MKSFGNRNDDMKKNEGVVSLQGEVLNVNNNLHLVENNTLVTGQKKFQWLRQQGSGRM